MAAGKRPGTPATKAAPSKAGGVIAGLAIVAVIAICVGFGVFNSDSDTTVPAPAAIERADTVPILAQATASQGICYGWRLESRFDSVVSEGSNLGDGVPVVDDPSCPRWIQVTASVRYTPESSELEDHATVDVTGSPDIDRADLYAVENGLRRFGLDSDVFVDDPGWAICRAAVALPLLVAEAGVAQPAAAPTGSPGATVTPLPDAGSDLWRARWGFLLAAAGLLLLAGALVTVGVVQRKRRHSRPHVGRAGGGK
jgi:hypothetical protein